jgi:hypothetical protein
VLPIDGEGAVGMRLAGWAAHGAPAGQRVGAAEASGGPHAGTMARRWERPRSLTTPSGGMWKFHVHHPDTNTWEEDRPIYNPKD